jgi:hypothetical protein
MEDAGNAFPCSLLIHGSPSTFSFKSFMAINVEALEDPVSWAKSLKDFL